MINGNTFKTDEATGFLVPAEGHSVTGFTADLKLKFLAAYKECSNIGKAAKAVGVSRSNVHNHLKVDDKFREVFLDLVEQACDDLEEVVLDNAKKGQFLPAMAYLRAYRAHRWGNKTVIQHNSSDKEVGKLLDGYDGEVIDVSPLPSEGDKQA